MTRHLLKKRSRQVLLGAVAIFLSSLAALGQAPAAALVTAAPALPDSPTPATHASIPAKDAPKAAVTILEDTVIRVRTNEPVNSKRVEQGSPVLFTLSEDVVVRDVVAIPRGATLRGVVMKSKKAGTLTGSPELMLKLISLELGGQSYPLYTYPFDVKGTSKTGPTETKAVRGAAVGAVVGAMVGSPSAKGGSTDAGRVASMTAGAAVGAGVGTMVSAATPGPGIWIPSEAQVDFYLASPVAVIPVSAKEAARLAQGLHPGGPSLYVRDETH